MKNLLTKLSNAKAAIKNSGAKKQGKNDFSKYNYFTPEQVEQLVFDACLKEKLLTKFDLVRIDGEPTGQLNIYDLKTGDKITFEMATAIPEIKATNVAQQIGGCLTYTERYLKMTAFGIVENSLDFDTTENTERREKEPAQVDERPWLNLLGKDGKPAAAWYKIKERIEAGEEISLASIRRKMNVSKADQERLKTDFNII